MKPTPILEVEPYRVRTGTSASSRFDGNNGMFVFLLLNGPALQVIVSDTDGWEHASVVPVARRRTEGHTHPLGRTPSWEEMDHVKRLFWRDDETVVQYHVPRVEHVNVHEYCLHLWRPSEGEILLPPSLFV